MQITTWPHRRITGWGGTEDVPELCPWVDLVDALTRTWDTPALGVGYFVPGTEGDPGQPRLKRSAGAVLARAGLEPVMRVVWVDVDNEPHKPWDHPDICKGRAPGDLVRETLAHVAQLCPNAGVYPTNAGYRLVWVLESPIPVSSYRSWATAWLAELGTRGIQADPTCAQWSRGYALPRVSGVLEGPRAHLRDLALLDPLVQGARLSWHPMSTDLAMSDAVAHLHTWGDAPRVPPPATLDRVHVPRDLYLALAASSALDDGVAEAVRTGAPFAGLGGRDTTLVQLCGLLAPLAVYHHPHGVDPGTYDPAALVVLATLHRSLSRMQALAPDAPTHAKAWDKACEYVANTRAERGAVPPPAPAEEHGPVIVGYGAMVCVRTPAGHYGPLVPERYLHQQLIAQAAPVDPWRRTRKGLPGGLVPVAELLAVHGVPAQRKIARYGHSSTTYDADTGTLAVGSCAVVDVTPQYHPEIAMWLQGLVPDPTAHGHVLDWLATCHDTTRPTAALYLQGPPGVGKTLFAACVAGIWGADPVSFESVCARFNQDSLLSCPVVALSEGITHGNRTHLTAAFRRLTAEDTHTIEAKWQSTGTLHGCPRVLILANNANALPLTGHHTRADLDAITARILHVQCGDTRAHLAAVGGHDVLAGWVGGAFAEHVAWLRDHRPVTPGPRFLVPGYTTQWHRDLTLSAGANVQILGAVVAAIVRGHTAVVVTPHTDPQRAQIAVNPTLLHRAWRLLLEEDQPRPLRADLVQGVRDLSPADTSQVRRVPSGTVRVWELDTAQVLRVAQLHAVPEFAALLSRLGGVVPQTTQGG